MQEKYDLGFKLNKKDENEPKKVLPKEWQKFYDDILPKLIREETEAFDYSVIAYTDSSLMDEISNNLDECKNDMQRDIYIFSLLTPFKECSDKINPIAEIKRLKGEVNGICGIKDFERDLAMWESMPGSKQIKNINECPHVPQLAKFKPPRCPIGVYWNTLCLMRDVWTIKTYMI